MATGTRGKSAARGKAGPPARETYRHGDLRRALIEAGTALAREGGPEAVVLREATRRAGVAPNAAYRHFENRLDLLSAVRSAAMARAAQAMEAELAALGPARAGATYARGSVRAVGTAYMRFAREETGLFRTAFGVPYPVEYEPDPEKAGATGLNPFQLLGAALDRMVEAGLMAKKKRPGAEYLAWSTVHGMAMLAIDGPLRALPPAAVDALGQRLLDMVEAGLGGRAVA